MNRPEKPSQPGNEIDLATEPDFTLGDLHVRPSTREVVRDGEVQLLEPRVMQVLVALAQANGAVVSRETLAERCWGGRIVGEDALQRCIGRLRRLAEAGEGRCFTIETVARVGYRLERATAQASNGEQTNAPAATVPPGTPQSTPRRLAWGLAAALVLLATGSVAIIALTGRLASTPDVTIAVLPFDDFSAQQDSKFLAVGISEEILSLLSRSSDMRVVARNSSFRFTTQQVAGAAKALNATHVLEGSVRKEGDRLRVVVHLSDTKRASTVWSETYDRPLTHALILQSEIAERVADALNARLGTNAMRQAQEMDPRAYEHYLKGRELFRARTPANLKRAIPELEQAVRLAPAHTRSWTTLAAARMFVSDRSTPEGRALIAGARDAVERALALEPNSGEGLAVLAQLTPYMGHWQQVDELFERALSLEPANAQIMNWRAIFLGGVGRNRESLDVVRRAYESDPLTNVVAGNFARSLMYAGNVEAGKKIMDDRRGGFDVWLNYFLEGDYLRRKKDWTALAPWAARPPPDLKAHDGAFATLMHDTASALSAQKTAEFAALRDRWKQLARAQPWYADVCVEFLLAIGERQAALEIIEIILAPDPNARQADVPLFVMLFDDPSLAGDPRIVSLMHRWGLFDYWRESGHWPDFCAAPGLPYDCKKEAQRTNAERLNHANR